MLTTNEEKALARAARILEKYARYGAIAFTSAKESTRYFQTRIGCKEREHFMVAALDNQNRLIECNDMFAGTINEASVFPREVIKWLLSVNAASVIYAHNHPSGITEPSNSDRQITTRLTQAAAMFGIRTLDHLVVSAEGSVSMAERGWI